MDETSEIPSAKAPDDELGYKRPDEAGAVDPNATGGQPPALPPAGPDGTAPPGLDGFVLPDVMSPLLGGLHNLGNDFLTMPFAPDTTKTPDLSALAAGASCST